MNSSRHPLIVNRRQFITLLAGFACTPLLPGCSFEKKPLRIGLHVWPGYEPTPLAASMGWLDHNLIKLVQTKAATDSLRLLQLGELDGAGLTLDEVLRARDLGIQLSVVLICDISAGADMFLVRPPINTLAGIKGLKIAVEDGALGALMLNEVLQVAQLKLEDVIPVSLSIDQHVDAWRKSEIDAVVTYEPAANEIMSMGGVSLFDSSHLPDLIVDTLAIRTKLLNSYHSEAVHHLVATHLRGLSHINTNPEDASYRMAPRFNLPPEKVMATFKGLVLPDLENNIRLIATAKPVIQSSAAVIADTLLKAGILHKPANLVELLHPEYLPTRLS
jgi:NitT/TauT family transport system substrate-binding protein